MSTPINSYHTSSSTQHIATNFIGSFRLARGIQACKNPYEVYSGQPVLAFTYVPITYVPSSGDVTLEATITVEAKTNVTELQPPLPTAILYSVKMVPIPWARGWYLAYIPGLPAMTQSFEVKFPFKTVRAGFSIVSSVEYKLIVNGSVIVYDSYTVRKAGVFQEDPSTGIRISL